MNDIDKFVFYPLLYSAIVYWGLSGFWFLLDIYLAPKYRINGGEIINWNLYKKTAIRVSLLQSTTPFVLYLMIPLWKLRGIETSWSNFLSIITLIKFLFCPILSDLIFYITHKLCHLKIFYSNVHKIHHEWVVPCALAAAYTSIYEYIFCNLPTFLLPPLILNINWYGANCWFIFATVRIVNDHSGYTFFESSIHHTNHHKYKMYNYGSERLDNILDTKKNQ